MTVIKSLGKLVLSTALVGVLIALAIAPVAGVSGVAVARTNDTMQSDIQDLTNGEAPGVSTILDAKGNTLAYIYEQRRHPVQPDEISDAMKQAVVAIEDRRFYEHEGVDLQGNLRALWTNLSAGGVSQGASTLDQQYVKNYLLLVNATTDEERQAATEQSVARKLREMRMATDIDAKLSKDEILANYLNLVPFGNHAYGVEAAARTYFGTSAENLTVPQAAMLAGMVQSSEYLNPYTNEEGVIERRNMVLQAMADTGSLSQEDADSFAQEPLGVLDSPATLANGCIGAGDRGFFCDYVLEYLDEKGIDREHLTRGGLTIKTTLDPDVQDQALNAVRSHTAPDAEGVAEVMNVIQPGTSTRKVLAMVSSRTYGLDLNNNETLLPQPNSLVGNGAGSVFKLFTAAAALEAGYGIKDKLAVPKRYEAEGLGYGGAANCPPNKYCVENAGSYAPTMTMQDTLAYSPNTPFIQLTEQLGVERLVDIAVKLGLRSYEEPGSYDGETSIANHIKESNLGSFTLGPTAVNALELSNVGATVASQGMWCEPNPIEEVTDSHGNEVYLKHTPCERAVGKEVAKALENNMTADTEKGTAADSARAAGFSGQAAAKTGTTESNQSSAFLGFNSAVAAAPYIYNDGTTTSPLCTGPVRQCASGNLFGGKEPAATFYTMAARVPAAQKGTVPDYDRAYDSGTVSPLIDGLKGKSESQARSALEKAGFVVKTTEVPAPGVGYGKVVRVITGPSGAKKGSEVTLQLSDGSASDSSSANSDQAAWDSTYGAPPAPSGDGAGTGGGQPSQSEPLFSQEDVDRFTNDVRSFFGL
ncbi:transglycosylase domain-containing protein [Corynebacterium sp. HMSC062A03]|uniref:transglycosylase domain-containing protein n=1 Tax=Corynebacterium sp. HMSC062A03 TaxID=1739285 RepID=UPI001FEF2C17|nr:transglycosylase domain-containing protein [Corynebacterium sp. HMSC062A03]